MYGALQESIRGFSDVETSEQSGLYLNTSYTDKLLIPKSQKTPVDNSSKPYLKWVIPNQGWLGARIMNPRVVSGR